MVVFAFMAMTNLVLAGPGCSVSKGDKAACAKTCGINDAKAEKTEGQMINADGKAGCDYAGKCETISMNITGMTCGGCESSITTALMKQDGVIKVLAIDHKSGTATVCFDPTKVKSDKLASLVTEKGYKAEIMPAVATTGVDADKAHACPAMSKAKAETEETTEKKDY